MVPLMKDQEKKQQRLDDFIKLIIPSFTNHQTETATQMMEQ